MGTTEKVNSVINALRIVRSFTHAQPVKRVKDISEELDLPKSTVSRLISSLVSEGFLAKDTDSSAYLLGPSIFTLGGIYLTSTHIFQEVTPVLTNVSFETKESVHISILKDYNVLYFNKSIGPYYSELESEIGIEQPAYLTSSGKVLLAGKDETYIENMLKDETVSFPVHSKEKIIKFKEELVQIRRQGYSLNIGLLKKDNYSIAVPVYDEYGEVACAISIIAPVSRMSDAKTKKFIQLLFEAAEEASERLAFAL